MTFIERLEIEKSELDEKLSKLIPFFDTEIFADLSSEMQALMIEQCAVMRKYSEILGKRIEILTVATTA